MDPGPRYAFIRPHEDSPVRFLSDDELAELFEDVANGESGITDWHSDVPAEHDPQYWPERSGLLIKFQILKPPSAS